MSKSRARVSPAAQTRRSNLLATIVTTLGVFALNASFDPTPVGADPSELHPSALPCFAKLEVPSRDSIQRPPADEASAAEVAKTVAGSENAESVVAPTDAAQVAAAVNDEVLTGRFALLMNILMLEKGQQFLSNLKNYTVTFHKRERIDGELSDLQRLAMKVQHRPFGVYMKWKEGGDRGREVLYVNGDYEGNMLVKLGGLKGRFLPTLKLDPMGSRALSETRYPITTAGILAMTEQLIEHRRRDLQAKDDVAVRMTADHSFNERPCYCFELDFSRPGLCRDYRRSVLCIDKEMSIPIAIRNYTWVTDSESLTATELEDMSLVEDYAFTEIDLRAKLATSDFDRTNADYSLRR